MALDALERLHGAVDQQPLRRPPDAQRRRLAEPLARQPLDAMRQLGISAMSMSTAATAPPTMPMPASGQPHHCASSSSVVARAACRVQSG